MNIISTECRTKYNENIWNEVEQKYDIFIRTDIKDFFKFNNVKRRELQQIIGNAVPSKAGFVVSLQLLANDIWSNFDEQA